MSRLPRRRAQVTALLLFALTETWCLGQAADAATIRGYGTISCGKWVKERQEPTTDFSGMGWVLGFVTAYDFYSTEAPPTFGKGIDNQALMAWIENYCRANPLDNLSRASEALVEEMKKRTTKRR